MFTLYVTIRSKFSQNGVFYLRAGCCNREIRLDEVPSSALKQINTRYFLDAQPKLEQEAFFVELSDSGLHGKCRFNLRGNCSIVAGPADRFSALGIRST